MRTVRDNYFIITGHTYDEYIRKYHRGLGSGRLFILTENETKYLNKHKFYWEVVGPDGNILYCQVYRIKLKHIIITLLILGLIAGAITAGIIYIPKLL